MIRKIIEATFPSAASITFRISSGRARSVKCGARTTPAVLLLEGDVPVGSELPITTCRRIRGSRVSLHVVNDGPVFEVSVAAKRAAVKLIKGPITAVCVRSYR
jgi:hypothetical protein